jgi:succinyl-diaminopimelate desuccinylase
MDSTGSASIFATELLALLEIPSVTGAETALADHLEGRFRGRAPAGVSWRRFGDSLVVAPPNVFEAERDDGPPDGAVAGARRPLIVLAGHLDTVPIGEAWPPALRGDQVFGRGAADMKAGLVAMLRLLEQLPAGEGFADRAYVFYAGEEGPAEENDLPNVLAAVPRLVRADLAILLEPTDGALELGCQGSLHARVTFRGRPCHSARPWLGLHPLPAALPWLARVLAHEPRPVRMQEVEFVEVVTVTQLHAGEARNVLPGTLEVNLNLRYPPDRTAMDAERLARSLCPEPRPLRDREPAAPRADEIGIESAEIGIESKEIGIEVEIVDHAVAGAIPMEAPLYRHLLETTGLSRRAKQAWTDVARFSALGVPALNWGPGDPRLAHTREEQVHVLQLEQVYEQMIRFLAGSGPGAGGGNR